MRATNVMVREWLLENGFDYVWFKPHVDARFGRQDMFYTKQGNFPSLDIWNLYDGICIDPYGIITFVQLSTTNYHAEEPYIEFMKDKKGFRVIMLRAVKKKSRWHIKAKEIFSEGSKEIDTNPDKDFKS